MIPFAVMFSVGVNLSILEFHLISYGIEENEIGFWYTIYTVGYMISSIIMLWECRIPKPLVINFGLVLMGIGFFLLGPSPLAFDRDFALMCIGLHLIGWATCLIYSIFYLVPCIPNMIEVSHREYFYEKDERQWWKFWMNSK